MLDPTQPAFCAWNPPPLHPRLPPATVHVWRAGLDLPAGWVEQLATTLAPDEQRRARGLRIPTERRRYTVGRGVLRSILGRYLAQPPDAIRFVYGPQGKPELAGGETPRLAFSVAHSGELALYAISASPAVGIDLEWVRPLPYAEVAHLVCTPEEYAALRALPGDQQAPAFFRAWCGKEAVLKALGRGWTSDPGVTFAQIAATGHFRLPVTEVSWHLRVLAPAPGYVAAVAAAEEHLACWQWAG